MNKTKKIVLFDIDNTLFDTERFKQTNREVFSLYEEVYEVLEELAPVADLGIFSEGEIAFQQKKLKQTNIEKYFIEEHVHIVPQKIHAIELLLKKYKHNNKIFLVDDRLSILPLIKKDFPSVFTIWMKRGEFFSHQKPIEGFSPDAEVDTLKEIIPLIANH
jgi:FMN phosphatase YigB (HAD superfamily)